MDMEDIEKYMQEYNYQDDSKDNNDFMVIFIICGMSIIFLTLSIFSIKNIISLVVCNLPGKNSHLYPYICLHEPTYNIL